jgi:hypothetical protein
MPQSWFASVLVLRAAIRMDLRMSLPWLFAVLSAGVDVTYKVLQVVTA